MTKDENKNKFNTKKPSDREPDEVLDLLQEFYQPEMEDLQEFTEFYDAIDRKLTEQNPVHRISKLGDDLEASLSEREQKLAKYIRRLEQKRTQADQRPNPQPPSQPVTSRSYFSFKLLASILVLVLIALASIASLKNLQSYNYISLEGDDIDWKTLNLTEKQQSKLQEVNQSWTAFQAQEQSFIDKRRNQLIEEMSKDKPDFSLMDKYQRDILDHEVALKREKLNSFLEKRFILTEEQSLKLMKAMSKKVK